MTAVLSNDAPPTPTRIRLTPVPRTAPPFDDEIGRSVHSPDRGRAQTGPVPVQGSLALAFALPSGVPAVPRPPARLRVVGRDLTRPTAPRRAGDAAARPDVARWAAMVVQAAVEVVAGDRPLTQLVRWTSVEVYEQLQWRRQRASATPVRTPGPAPRAVVSSVHVCQPREEVAEACAIVRRGERASAVAVRLEVDRDSWRCTAITLG